MHVRVPAVYCVWPQDWLVSSSSSSGEGVASSMRCKKAVNDEEGLLAENVGLARRACKRSIASLKLVRLGCSVDIMSV